MDKENQQFISTSSDMQTSGQDSEQLFPVDRLENNGDYWNDLVTAALGQDQHVMDSNIQHDDPSQHYHVSHTL